MSADDFIRVLEKEPFRPFRIHLSNGQAFDIRHPEFVWIFETRIEIGVPASRDPRVMDRADSIALSHIARLEELPLAA